MASQVKFDYYIFSSYVPELDGSPPQLYAKWLEQVEVAEELGFHCVWFTEHHFEAFGGMLPNPQLFMAAAAQRTQRIRLGTAVTVLPLHNPLRIAEDMAMLDALSNGRIEVGVGRGMEWLNYSAFGADRDTAHEQTEELTAVLQAAWTSDCFSWQGRFFQCAGPLRILPRPVQQPYPPIWMTANVNPEHFRWIGRQGLHLMTIPWILPNIERSRDLIGAYRDGLREAGHDPGSREVLGLYPTYVAATPERAREEVIPHWALNSRIAAEARHGQGIAADYDALVAGRRAFFGDPEMCRRQLDHVRQLGLDRIALHIHVGGLPQAQVLESMRLFMTEVAGAA